MMILNTSLAAHIDVPVYGPADADGARPIVGYRDGYHVNSAAELMQPAWEPYRVFPPQPVSVMAGVEPLFLRFVDEAEAQAIAPGLFMVAG